VLGAEEEDSFILQTAQQGLTNTLGLARARNGSLQPILKLADQVSHEPLSQRVISLACKNPQLVQSMMEVFGRWAHGTATPESEVRRRSYVSGTQQFSTYRLICRLTHVRLRVGREGLFQLLVPATVSPANGSVPRDSA
jgi:hypothetical protein